MDRAFASIEIVNKDLNKKYKDVLVSSLTDRANRLNTKKTYRVCMERWQTRSSETSTINRRTFNIKVIILLDVFKPILETLY